MKDTDESPGRTSRTIATSPDSIRGKSDSSIPLEFQREESGKVGSSKLPLPRISLLVLITSLSLGAWYTRSHWLASDDPTEQSKSRPLQNSVFALGQVEPVGEVISVAGPSGAVDARVAQLNVVIGDEVRKGDVLAVLDNHARLEQSVNVARCKLDQAKKRLEQTRVGVSSMRAELEAALVARQAQLATSQHHFERQKRLHDTRATSLQELEVAELDVQNGIAALRETESRLTKYSKKQEEAIDVQVALSDVIVAQANLEEATALLEQSYVRAPECGTILDVQVRAGERINMAPLLLMGNTQSMIVRAQVYESDVSRLKVGGEVIAHSSALANPLSGEVWAIANYVKQQSIVHAMPAANTDARVVDVFVRLDDESTESAAGFVGLQVRVEFR